MRTNFAAFALSVGLLLPSAEPRAEPLLDTHDAVLNSGHTLYQTYCAQCHGSDGKGGAADSLRATVKVPDLTTIAQRNDGVFPVGKVYDMISGSELLPAHGTRLMPVWGTALQSEPGLAADTAAVVARGRILSMVAYLATLQAR